MLQLVIEDPRQFLEYIPIEELNFIESGGEEKLALWHPTKLTTTFDYHLFTDEEVYRYCVTDDFAFPGLFQDGNLAFTVTELDATILSRIFSSTGRNGYAWHDSVLNEY